MSTLSFMLASTGDFLTVHDPRDAAGQPAWQRATDAAVQFTRKPGTQAAAKMLAVVGVRSSMGDPTKAGWMANLPAGHKAKVLEELAQLAVQWHLESGRNADGSRPDTVKAAQAEAAGLRLAADQAGPGRGELLVKAAIAERRASDLAKAARPQRRDRGRASSRRTWGDLFRTGLDIIPPATARALAKAATPTADLVGTEELYVRDAPDMLFKRAGQAG
jgi:hypothetical protein